MKSPFLVVLAVLAWASPVAAVTDCAALTKAKIDVTTIDEAREVAPPIKITAPDFTGPVELKIDRAFCRVKGTMKPSPTSNIKFEVWLPKEWNGRYLQSGNGGLAGFVPLASLAATLGKGYASGATDDGTTGGSDLSWQSDPERQLDYMKRAAHLTAVAGKALTRLYYGRPASHAYFFGGSKGGQEALEEVQSFPQDFDGVVALFPATHGLNQITTLFWSAQQMNRSPGAMLRQPQFDLLRAAALKQCAGKDGGRTGDPFLTYPPMCHFKPELLLCKGAASDSCLTSEQLKTAKAIYAGPSNPTTGEGYGTGMAPGSEAPGRDFSHGWNYLDGTTVRGLALENSVRLGLGISDPNWSYRSFRFDTDYDKLNKNPAMTAPSDQPRVHAFKAKGGRLLIVHGWSDPLIPTANSISFYKDIVADQERDSSRQARTSALAETQSFARLFLAPDYGHGGNNGLVPADPLAAMVAWVEQGQAPDKLSAEYREGGSKDGPVTIKRDLCAWPSHPWVNAAGATVCKP